MKFKKKASLLLAALVIGGSLVGCKKVDYVQLKEETPTLIHEDLSKEVKALEEDILNIYFLNKILPSDERTAKIEEFESKLTKEELEKVNKCVDLFYVAIAGLENEETKKSFTENINEDITKLLNNMYLNKGEELTLTESFNELNPVETMQSYLKENNITITSLNINDDIDIDFKTFPFVATLSYDIEGKVRKESFSETITQKFYFSPEDKDLLEKKPQQVPFRLDGLE